VLGDGANGNFASTTARNITIQNDYNTWFGEPVRRSVKIGTLLPGLMSGSTHVAYAGSALISGGITCSAVNNPVGSVNDMLVLINAKVFGNIDYSSTHVIGNLAFYNSMVVGTTTGTTVSLIYEAANCEFDGLVTVGKFNRAVMCDIQGGITVTSADSSSQPPSGFFGCKIGGTFTGPANSYRADGTTQALATPTLAGGATLVDLG
jgi:hypothetical protein